MRAYVALGANLGDPAAQVRGALESLAEHPELRMIAVSRLYRSAPLGPPGQSDYCNAVCAVDSEQTPEALLSTLLEFESRAGRTRTGSRWAARTLDLDLLHVEGQRRDTPALQLPHPGLSQRNFVLVPLAEVAPSLVIPGLGGVADLALRVGCQGLQPWPAKTESETFGGRKIA